MTGRGQGGSSCRMASSEHRFTRISARTRRRGSRAAGRSTSGRSSAAQSSREEAPRRREDAPTATKALTPGAAEGYGERTCCADRSHVHSGSWGVSDRVHQQRVRAANRKIPITEADNRHCAARPSPSTNRTEVWGRGRRWLGPARPWHRRPGARRNRTRHTGRETAADPGCRGVAADVVPQ